MRKKLFKLSIICMILTAAVRFGQPLQAYAASAALGFLLQGTEFQVGDTVNVYLTVEADEEIGDVEVYLSYDPDYLDFSLATSSVAGGDGVLKVSDVYSSSADTSKRYLMKFVALKPGTTQLSVMNQPKVYRAEDAGQMSVSSVVTPVTIAPSVEASDNTRLSSLKISPGTVTPEFHPETYVYRTTVSHETSSLYVSALPEDAKAKVTVSGSSALQVGENRVYIYVTAESGKLQEYIILVNRQAEEVLPTPTPEPEEPENVTPVPLPEDESYELKLEAVKEDGNVILQGKYRYQVCELTEAITIPAGFQKTKLMISGISLTAYTPQANEGSEFALLILRREGGEPALYRYDRTEKTIQRFVTEDIVVTREEPDPQETASQEQIEEYEKKVTALTFVIVFLITLWLLTIAGMIYLTLKKGSRDDFD